MNATSAGALLLCRAEPAAVRHPAHLLREQQLLAPAGEKWSVLVPEGKPWASAVAVGTNWPVLALWWDGDRSGFTLASGFRRPVGYVWLADGTPVGEDEAMRTFAARLGLDPVLDLQVLEPLTLPDPESDGPARLLGLIAVRARPARRAWPRRTGRPAAVGRPRAGRGAGGVVGLARCGTGGARRGRGGSARTVAARPGGPAAERGAAGGGSADGGAGGGTAAERRGRWRGRC